MEPVTTILAIIGALKWLTDNISDEDEKKKLKAKLAKLQKKYESMDHRTKVSKKVHDDIVEVEALLKANKNGEASNLLDGVLAAVGLAA